MKHLSMFCSKCNNFQSIAYIAGYNGKDEWEAGKIMELLAANDDMFGYLRPAFMMQDAEEKKKMASSIFAQHGVPFLDRLQKILEENDSGYFVGNNVRKHRKMAPRGGLSGRLMNSANDMNG